jgi:tRNA nucleotidyltransferase (CCA-adding enzyme)
MKQANGGSASESEVLAWQVVERLESAGHEAYLVGGCVRDQLLGRPVYDYDITTSALPEQVQALFSETIPTGIQHGTVSVVLNRERFEVTTFRMDGDYEDGRRPLEVVFVRSLREDLARRDFTINAMALGRDGELHDPFGGQDDLRVRLVRAVGEPERRFQEDALRMLRGIRFAAQLGFEIESATKTAIWREAHRLKTIARERIREEWHKMLLSSPQIALPLLQETGSLGYVLSRPQRFDLQVNDPWGRGVDPWVLAGKWATEAPCDLALRYCIGFRAVKMDDARMDRTLQELKLSGQLKKEIRGCWALNAFGDPERWNDRQWRDLFFKSGRESVWRACMLHAILQEESERQAYWQAEVQARAARQPIWSLQDLAVSGQDLLAAGVEAGPQLGRMLKRLAEAVLEEPGRNQREVLLGLVEEWQGR